MEFCSSRILMMLFSSHVLLIILQVLLSDVNSYAFLIWSLEMDVNTMQEQGLFYSCNEGLLFILKSITWRLFKDFSYELIIRNMNNLMVIHIVYTRSKYHIVKCLPSWQKVMGVLNYKHVLLLGMSCSIYCYMPCWLIAWHAAILSPRFHISKCSSVLRTWMHSNPDNNEVVTEDHLRPHKWCCSSVAAWKYIIIIGAFVHLHEYALPVSMMLIVCV